MLPDMSKGHPCYDAGNVERDDHVKENEKMFNLFSVEWCDECAQTIFHCGDKQFVDLSDGCRCPDQSDVKIQPTLAESCFVAYRFDNGVPTIYCEAHYGGGGCFAKYEEDVR